MVEELSTIQEICDEVECLRRLERKMKLDNEGMVNQSHDISLRLRILHLIRLDYEVFLERLHRKDLSI